MRFPSHGGRLLAVLIMPLAIACSMSEAERGAPTVRDSAGVRIVENTVPAWGGAEWSLSPEPILSIGQQDGDAAYLFHGVLRALQLSDGRIAVANQGSSEIRFFDAEGRFLSGVGGEGDGPGEFRLMSLVWRLPGDTIVVSDSRGLTVLDPRGGYVRTIQIDLTDSGLRAQPVGRLDDGTILGLSGSLAGIGPPRAGALVRDTMRFHRFDADGTYGRELVSFPGTDLWGYAAGATTTWRRVPFSAFPAWAAAGEHLYIGSGRANEIALWNAAGSRERIIRWPAGSGSVTAEHIAQYRDHLLASTTTPDARRRVEAMLAEVPMPDSLPATGEVSILIGDDGSIWVEAYRPPWETRREWFVFSNEGIWLGSVRPPAGFAIHDVGARFVLGGWRDALGVEYVRMYELTAPRAYDRQ